MSLGNGVLQRRFPFGLRWLGAGLWRLEHAFERARASGRAEDDARIRIFFVMALFSLGFLALAIGAAQAALFSDTARGGGAGWISPQARADRVDRHGRLLAADLPHYGLYIDPDEVWDVAATRAALRAALPFMTAAVTSLSEFRVTRQVPVPEQALQPSKVEPLAGIAVSVTTVPLS